MCCGIKLPSWITINIVIDCCLDMLTNHRFCKITARGYNPSLSFLIFSIIIFLVVHNYYPYYNYPYYILYITALIHLQ